MSYFDNPSLNLTFMFPDVNPSNVSILGHDIVRGSISLKKNLLSGLESASSRATLSLTGDTDVIKNIIRTEGDIKAVLSNGTETLFTGYISTKHSWSVNADGEQTFNITIEDVGTRLLDTVFVESGQHFFDTQANEVIEAVTEKAGVKLAQTIPSLTTKVTCLVEEGTTCKDILKNLLYELGYVYYFDNYGEMNLYKIDCTSTVGLRVANSENLVLKEDNAISLTKNIRKYNGVRASYERFAQAENYLVYRNTTGQDTSGGHPYCYMELKAGECFDGGEIYKPKSGETRTDYLIEGVNASSETEKVGSNEIVAVTAITDVVSTCIGGNITTEATTSGGKYLKVFAENKTSYLDYLTRFDVYGTITYVRDINVVRTTSSDKGILEEELSWIHDDELASTHANLVSSYYKYAAATYKFYSFQDFNEGEIIRLNDDVHTGLDVNVLITTKNYSDGTDYYEYEAVAISVFDLRQNTIKQTFATGKRPIKGDDGTSGVTYGLDCNADVIKSPSVNSTPTTTSVTLTPWIREGYSASRALVCNLKLEATSNYGSTSESWTTIQEVVSDTLTFTPEAGYQAYKVTMTYQNEVVATKTLPYVYDGASAPTVSIDISRNEVDYYADNIVVDDTPIQITVHSDRLCSLYINGVKVKEGQQLVEHEIIPSDYLDVNNSISINASASYAQATEIIRKNKYAGELTINAEKQYFEFYADNYPHDEDETITITVTSRGFKGYPKLNVDSVPVETPDEYTYTYELPVSELKYKEFLYVQTTLFDRSERVQISKIRDVGELKLSVNKDSLDFYADNRPHNNTDGVYLTIDQTGYSKMPTLTIMGVTTNASETNVYAYENGSYYLYANFLINWDYCVARISIDIDDQPWQWVYKEIEIYKNFDVATVNLQLDEDKVFYTYDNERLSGNVGFKVNYSGLFFEPTVEIDGEETETTEGRGEIPISLFDNKDSVSIRAYSPTVYYAYDTGIVTKEVQPLNLSFYMTAGQFNYGENNEISPSEIIVTNTTTGISNPEDVELYVGSNKVEWVNEKYTITPDMVEGRYLEVRVVYGEEERSSIITKTYDGKTLRLSADSPFFHLDSEGNIIEGQKITLTVHSSGIDEAIIWANNKGLNIPDNTMSYEVVPTDDTPYTFTITAGKLSDTLTLNFVRDGRDGASAGTYLGAYKQDPTTKPDGSSLANGDYYLNINDSTQPIPYKYLDGQWYAVTSEDPDWSLIASTTQNDVSKYCTSVISTNSYYGFFQLLASNKAVIDTLGTQEIIIKDDGSITSESFIESDGLEGFQINDEGITANKGTWRGAFANGLTFVPETSVKIPKEMSQADAYKAIRAAGIADGTYYEGSIHERGTYYSEIESLGEDGYIPNPPAFFAPYTSNVLGSLNLVSSKMSWKDNVWDSYHELAQSNYLPSDVYLFDVLSIGWGSWLFVIGKHDSTTQPNSPCVVTDLYLMTKEGLADMLHASITTGSVDLRNYSKKISITNFELPKYNSVDYGLNGNVSIFVDEEVTNTTWILSRGSNISVQRMLSNRSEFDEGTPLKLTLKDGTVCTEFYFTSVFIANYGHFHVIEENGEKYIEAMFLNNNPTLYILARTQDMINWSSVVEVDYSTMQQAIAYYAGDNAMSGGPIDFTLDNDGNLFFNARAVDGNDINYFFSGIYDVENNTAGILPNTHAVFTIDLNDESYGFENDSQKMYITPLAYRYPLIVKGNMIYGTVQGLNFFSYNKETRVYTDLTWVFNELKFGIHKSDNPEEFVLSSDNVMLKNVAPLVETPDFTSIYMADSNLIITGIKEHNGIIYLTFLYKREMTILGEYNIEKNTIQFNTMNSLACPYTSLTMDETPTFYEEEGKEVINYVSHGIMNFSSYPTLEKHVGYTYVMDNMTKDEVASIGIPSIKTSNTMSLPIKGLQDPYGAIALSEEKFLIVSPETGLFTITLDGIGNGSYPTPVYLTSEHPELQFLLNTAFVRANDDFLHLFAGRIHLKINSDGEVVLSENVKIDGAELTSDDWMLVYGYTSNGTINYIDGKMYLNFMDFAAYNIIYAVSEDGSNWTSLQTFNAKGTDGVEAMVFAGVEVEDSVYQRILPRIAMNTETSNYSCQIVGYKSTGEEVVLASKTLTDMLNMQVAIMSGYPSIQKKDGVYYLTNFDTLYTYSNGVLNEVLSIPCNIVNFGFNGDKIIVYGEVAVATEDPVAIINEYTYDGTLSLTRTFDNAYLYGGGFKDFYTTSDGDYISTIASFINSVSSTPHLLPIFIAGTERFTYKEEAGIEAIYMYVNSIIMDSTLLSMYVRSGWSNILTYQLAGAYDLLAPEARVVRVDDEEIEFTGLCVLDACAVDIREKDNKIEIRLLPINRYYDDSIQAKDMMGMIPMPITSLWNNFFYLSNTDTVKPFLVIDKNSEEPVGTTFYWNFPAQLTSSFEQEVRAPIIRDGTINSAADSAIPDSFINSLPTN